MSDIQTDATDIIALTGDIVCAYVSNNHVQPAELSQLIAVVHGALAGLGAPVAETKEANEKATAAQIRRSIQPDFLVSFEDGKQYKTLRRHLNLHGLTPDQYRAKWGLASDYPMTSANYSARRSELARSLGLGQQRRKGKAAVAAQPEAQPEPVAAPAPAEKASRGRPRKKAA